MYLHDSCRSQVFQYARLLQESSISMYDSCRSQASPSMSVQESCMSVCMTPSGVKYLNV